MAGHSPSKDGCSSERASPGHPRGSASVRPKCFAVRRSGGVVGRRHGRDKLDHDGLGSRGFHASRFIGGVGPEACEELTACQITSALSVIASKAKQSRLGLRVSGLVWIASLSLAMTTSRFLYSLTTSMRVRSAGQLRAAVDRFVDRLALVPSSAAPRRCSEVSQPTLRPKGARPI